MFVGRMLAVFLLMLGFLTSSSTGAQLEFPQAKGWVNDFAGVMDATVRKQLTAICVELDHRTNAQIAVVTVETTDGTPIGDYARLLFNKWGIGHKEDNRGMLVLLSTKEHNYFISVGRGFETLFPNQRVAEIGAKMIPDLRRRHYDAALLRGVDEIASIIAHERGITLKTVRARSTQREPKLAEVCFSSYSRRVPYISDLCSAGADECVRPYSSDGVLI